VGQTPFTIQDDFQWTDLTADLPSQYRLNAKDCPFPEEYRRDSEKSQLLEARVVLSLFGVSAVAALVTYLLVGRKQPMVPLEDSSAPWDSRHDDHHLNPRRSRLHWPPDS
jgi:hypothetical protein